MSWERSVVDHVDRFASSDEPGVIVGVRRNGETLLVAASGLADLRSGTPLAAGHVVGIASLTKPLTAALVLGLCRDGDLDLDATLSAAADRPRLDGRPNIDHALSHTSGVPNYVTMPQFASLMERQDLDLDMVLALVDDCALNFDPGTRYGYSNSGYRLLERACELAGGARYADLLAERVFQPLGMSSARVLDANAPAADEAVGYVLEGAEWRPAAPATWAIAGGAGAVGCSLLDWLSLDEALFDKKVLPDPIHQAMTTPVRLASGRTEDIGRGWVLTSYRGNRVVTFSGGAPGYSACYVRLVTADVSVSVLSNREGASTPRLARSVVDCILGHVEPPEAIAPATLGPEWEGDYADTLSSRSLRNRDGSWWLESATDRIGLGTMAGRATLVSLDDPETSVVLHSERPRALTLRTPFTWFTGYRSGNG